MINNNLIKYLRSFVIGSSLPSFFVFFYTLAIINEKLYNYPYDIYVMLTPVYLGIMNIFATILRNNFSISLERSLLIISIITFVITVSFAYFNNIYIYTYYQWFNYFSSQLIKYFIVFNFIIYTIEKFYSKSRLLKSFIIGSSWLVFIIGIYRVYQYKKYGLLNYNFKLLTFTEPLYLGISYALLLFFMNNFNIPLRLGYTLWPFIAILFWFFGAYNLKSYRHKNITEWINHAIILIIYGIIRNNLIIYYLETLT